MHDPLTVAFNIKRPWPYRGFHNEWYWPSLITIWHVDPEKGGSDDSCGWFTPPFSKTQREIVKTLAADEAREPWFMSLSAKANLNPVECESYIRGAFLLVSRCLENRCGWRPWRWIKRSVSVAEATHWAALMTHNSIDNFRTSLCFLSGWHGNLYRNPEPNTIDEDKWFREENAKSFFGAIMGYILRSRRPWYRRPRWHIHHWSVQIHFLQDFKRWAFSRCSICGKRFSWGYAPCTNSWHGRGPAWFKSEDGVFHSECDGRGAKSTPQAMGVGGAE